MIAILTCCGFGLVRLVHNRLQTWKEIACKWQNFTVDLKLGWILSTGRITGTRSEIQQTEENKLQFFITDTQTEAIKYQDTASEHAYARFFSNYLRLLALSRSQSIVVFYFSR